METKPPPRSRSAQIGIIFGAALIFLGLVKLSGAFLWSSWWRVFRNFVVSLFSYLWPTALIVAGIYLVWAARKGKFKDASLKGKPPLRKSVLDKRMAGVCGGIAEFLGIDSTVVRVFVIIVLLINPPFVLIAYVLAALLLPKS